MDELVDWISWRRRQVAALATATYYQIVPFIGTRADSRIATARRKADDRVTRESLVQFMRQQLAEVSPPFSTEFTEPIPHGELAEGVPVLDPVTTEGRERIQKLIVEFPMVRLGLAGPRGIGKTQTIDSVITGLKALESVSTTGGQASATSQNGGQPSQQNRDVLTVKLSAPVSFRARDFILFMFERLCHEVIGKEPDISGLRLTLRKFGIGTARRWRRFWNIRRIEDRAAEHLKTIRFQRSYSGGWGGSVTSTVPGISWNKATNVAERTRTLPQIAQDYKDFASEVVISKKCRIVVMIDELDKMASIVEAENFLNELKILFGTNWTYFVISVSENAMSRFERRGIPFRDAFDSALDEVVHLDYMNFEQSVTLINRRALRVPIPFLFFASCIAGGLPRDMIRICRSILDTVDLIFARNQSRNQNGASGNGSKPVPVPNATRFKKLPEPSIPGIIEYHMGAEIRDKLRAIRFAANNRSREPEAYRLLQIVLDLESPKVETTDISILYCEYDKLKELYCEIKPAELTEQEKQADESDIKEFCGQLIVYLRFAMTLLQFMRERTSVEKWEQAANGDKPDDHDHENDALYILHDSVLADWHFRFSRARQSLVSPIQIAENRIELCEQLLDKSLAEYAAPSEQETVSADV